MQPPLANFRSWMVCYHSYQLFHKPLSICPVRHTVGWGLYNRLGTTLRLYLGRANNKHFAPPPIASTLISKGYSHIIFMPFKEPLLCQCLHRLHRLSKPSEGYHPPTAAHLKSRACLSILYPHIGESSLHHYHHVSPTR